MLVAAGAKPYTLRAGRPHDAATMAVIDAAVSLSPWSERRLAQACLDDGVTGWRVRVIDDAGEVLGFLVYACVMDEATLYQIAVRAESQGRGVGQTLLNFALQEMRREGASRCLLDVRESNQVARRLYQRSGFCTDGVRKHYYPSPHGREDALLMSVEL